MRNNVKAQGYCFKSELIPNSIWRKSFNLKKCAPLFCTVSKKRSSSLIWLKTRETNKRVIIHLFNILRCSDYMFIYLWSQNVRMKETILLNIFFKLYKIVIVHCVFCVRQYILTTLSKRDDFIRLFSCTNFYNLILYIFLFLFFRHVMRSMDNNLLWTRLLS